MFKNILVVSLMSLISACGSSNDESSDPIDSFEYEGDWGRSFLLYQDEGLTTCIKEILSITETTWKVYQFVYLNEACNRFAIQNEFEGSIVSEADEVVDGLPVKRLFIENIDWILSGRIEPFFLSPSRSDKVSDDALFEIEKAIFWDTFKVESFELDLFQDGDSLFSNTYGISSDPNSVLFSPVDSDSIILDSGYIKVTSIDKEQVDKLQP